MNKNLALFVISVLILSVGLFGVSFGGNEAIPGDRTTSENIISVTGHGVISVKPDVCYVSLGVEIQGKTAREVSEQGATLMNNIINAIKNIEFSDEDFETVEYSLTPVYTYPQNEPPVLTGYRLRNIVRVRITQKNEQGDLDTTFIGEVIDAATENGANVISGITFDVLNKKDLKLQAITLAMEDAKEKAETALAAVNETIKTVIEISVSDVSFPSWAGKDMNLRVETTPPIFTGSQNITVTVNVKFGF